MLKGITVCALYTMHSSKSPAQCVSYSRQNITRNVSLVLYNNAWISCCCFFFFFCYNKTFPCAHITLLFSHFFVEYCNVQLRYHEHLCHIWHLCAFRCCGYPHIHADKQMSALPVSWEPQLPCVGFSQQLLLCCWHLPRLCTSVIKWAHQRLSLGSWEAQ